MVDRAALEMRCTGNCTGVRILSLRKMANRKRRIFPSLFSILSSSHLDKYPASTTAPTATEYSTQSKNDETSTNRHFLS